MVRRAIQYRFEKDMFGDIILRGRKRMPGKNSWFFEFGTPLEMINKFKINK